MEAVWLSAFGLLVLLWVVTRSRRDSSPGQAGTRNGQPQDGRSRRQPRPQSPLPVLYNNGSDDDDLEITVIKASPFAALATNVDEDIDPSSEDLAHAEASRVNVIYGEEADVEEVTSPFARILISVEGESDRGRARTRNEDSFLVLRERSLFVIADGMGGYDGGQIASALAVETLRSAFEHNVFEAKTESAAPVPRRGRELACAIQMANEAIWAAAKKTPQYSHMGTTVVAARFSPNKQRVYIGHVGDSRCYRLRGNTLRQLTTDHTLGELGMRGPVSHHLFQAVGIRPSMTIDLIVDKPRANDLYLLCSDGLSKMMKDEEIREVLICEPDLEAAVYTLIERANDQGGRDNVTVILLKVLERAQSPAALMLQRHPGGSSSAGDGAAAQSSAQPKLDGEPESASDPDNRVEFTVDVDDSTLPVSAPGSQGSSAEVAATIETAADNKTTAATETAPAGKSAANAEPAVGTKPASAGELSEAQPVSPGKPRGGDATATKSAAVPASAGAESSIDELPPSAGKSRQ